MINYHVLDGSVVLNYDGKTKVISNDDARYNKVLASIRANTLEEIPAIVEIERGFNRDGIELVDGLLHANGTPMPSELSERILKFKEQELPFEPLLNFWDNLKKNPSFNARKMLFKFLEHNGHPLTSDGCFIAYRGVTDDFKDVHTGSFDNKVGSVCEMPRDAVDDNPNNTCSSGLHVACHSYAKGFGPKLIEVKVNPADVVAVPVDYNGTKMRTCRFEVVAEGENERTDHLYGVEAIERPEVDFETEESEEESCSNNGCDNGQGVECDEHCQNCGEERSSFNNYCGECGSDLN